MPELPEVETIVRDLAPKLKELEIRSFTVIYSPILRKKREDLIDQLKGKKILDVRRRGKMILLCCQGNISLLFHLKMTGMFLFSDQEQELDRHTHFILSFKGQERELRFRDVRKFGFISCVRTDEDSGIDELKPLGPEPLEIDFRAFQRLFQRRKACLKSLLLNQRFIAGIGNIYADEILFRSRLHPLIPASQLRKDDLKRLHKAVRDVLMNAIEHRGSTIKDFKDAAGQEGNFQNHLKVYGRESLPCFTCKESITRLRIGGRSSFFCPECQKEK